MRSASTITSRLPSHVHAWTSLDDGYDASVNFAELMMHNYIIVMCSHHKFDNKVNRNESYDDYCQLHLSEAFSNEFLELSSRRFPHGEEKNYFRLWNWNISVWFRIIVYSICMID